MNCLEAQDVEKGKISGPYRLTMGVTSVVLNREFLITSAVPTKNMAKLLFIIPKDISLVFNLQASSSGVDYSKPELARPDYRLITAIVGREGHKKRLAVSRNGEIFLYVDSVAVNSLENDVTFSAGLGMKLDLLTGPLGDRPTESFVASLRETNANAARR